MSSETADESDVSDQYEVVVVGGGPGGLTTALYTTRLNHDTALIDRGGGRAAMMAETHNVIGIPEETSGNEFLQTAKEQLDYYGTDRYRDFVTSVEHSDEPGVRFEVETAGGERFHTEAVVLSTGFSDNRADPPLPRTGSGLHYCLHCDAYVFRDEPVYVMGHDEGAAHVAMIMLNFTDDVDLRTVATHGYQPDLLASINRNGDSQSQKLCNVVSFRCRFSVTHGSIGDPAATLPVVVNKGNCATSYR